jgi:sarcosine oxidase gamma subunit
MLGDSPQQCVRFEPCQDSSNARMHAMTPAHVPAVVPLDVEAVWLGPPAWIAICSGEHQAAALTRRNDDAFYFDLAQGDPTSHARRRIPAQALFESCADQGTVRTHEPVLIRK